MDNWVVNNWVVNFDFVSLYPNQMKKFGIVSTTRQIKIIKILKNITKSKLLKY